MPSNIAKIKKSMRIGFPSLQELIRHFEDRLSILEIENIIRETGQLFIYRGVETDEQERVTFIQRCHQALQGSFLLRKEELVGEMPKTRA